MNDLRIKRATPKEQTVDLLQTVLRAWLQQALPSAQFNEMMRNVEWMRSQPSDIQVRTAFETDPLTKQMRLQVVFSFPGLAGAVPAGLVLPNGVGKH